MLPHKAANFMGVPNFINRIFLEKIVMGLYHFRTSDPSEILTATELKCMNRLQKIVTIDHISKANFYVRFGVNPCG